MHNIRKLASKRELRCLNTVCARSVICTADVYKRAHKALRKTNTEPVQRAFHFVQ